MLVQGGLKIITIPQYYTLHNTPISFPIFPHRLPNPPIISLMPTFEAEQKKGAAINCENSAIVTTRKAGTKRSQTRKERQSQGDDAAGWKMESNSERKRPKIRQFNKALRTKDQKQRTKAKAKATPIKAISKVRAKAWHGLSKEAQRGMGKEKNAQKGRARPSLLRRCRRR